MALLKAFRTHPEEQTGARRLRRAGRPVWQAMIGGAERILGRKWAAMTGCHGDWGRDAVLAVATRRLAEAVREIPGLQYNAAAQGVRRFYVSAVLKFV